MIDLIIKIIYAIIICSGTTICGIPIIFRFVQNARWTTKIFLSFSAGFVLLLLSGIAANALLINPFLIQIVCLIVCCIATIPIRSTLTIELDRVDKIVISLGIVYALILIAFFNSIIMWMAGDAVTHASMIRMIIDGESVPVSFFPFGSAWEVYPKGFHFYSFFWIRGFSVLGGIQVIPVLISTMTPFLFYSFIREMKDTEISLSLYTFIFACFCFPAHYAYLIWAGYPSIAAEMLLVASLVAIIIEKRLLIVFIMGMLFVHPRFLVFLFGILTVWGIFILLQHYEREIRKHLYLTLLLIGFGICCLVVCLGVLFPVHPPALLTSIISDRSLATDYISRWLWALLALFGIIIALYQRKRSEVLCGAWIISMILIAVFIDLGPLTWLTAADRVYSLLYLPLAFFAAIPIVTMVSSHPKTKTAFLFVILIIGLLMMGVVFSSYSASWKIPREDYDAIMWMDQQKDQNITCMNLDPTGGWIYPLTGIKILNPGPLLRDINSNSNNFKLWNQMLVNPDSQRTRDMMDQFKIPVYIFVSNASLSKKTSEIPFSRASDRFPVIRNISFSQDFFDIPYTEGVIIARFPKVVSGSK